MSPNYRILASTLVAIAIILIALFFRFNTNKLESNKLSNSELATMNRADEVHTHQQMLIFINGKLLDLNRLNYMEKDERIHFHDNDGTLIHTHVADATLPELFKSIGMKLTYNCFTDDLGTQYCSDATSTLSILINKSKSNEVISKYMLNNYDKILINYGTDTPQTIQMKANAIPGFETQYEY